MFKLAAALAARPRLLIAFAVAAGAAALLFIVPNPLRFTTRAILAWDASALVFILLALHRMAGCPVETMRAEAARQDEGGAAILALSLFAAAVGLVALTAELSQAKGEHGLVGSLRIILAFATVVLSWFFVHTVFAFHYAHLYYTEPKSLQFPGTEEPCYAEFMYFALVVGMTAQVSDVVTGTPAMRRVVMTHGVISFFFNTAILALGVNLAAGLAK